MLLPLIVTVNMIVEVRYTVRSLPVVTVLVLVERALSGLVTVRVIVTSLVWSMLLVTTFVLHTERMEET